MKYIGIDIGDGESAVTVVSEYGAILPAVVTLGNVKSIRSVVGTLKEKSVIGDQVVLNHAVTNRSARFKSRFLYQEEARRDLARFAQGLYELVDKSLNDKDWQITLGCPAAWKQEARERYSAIVQSAGFRNVHTVSESRAAFLYAHYGNELHLSPETLKRSTLVIDIGSSTLDYAYIVDGKERDVGVFGENHLGGGILDELILDYAVKTAPNSKKIRHSLDNSPSWKNYCELIARKLKEEYFLNETAWALKSCTDIAPIFADPSAPLSLQISLSGEIIAKLLDQKLEQLGGISFREALAASLERAREITSENPVELLIVTGGASRMKFFQQLCTAAFPTAQMILCEEPEFSIARGLGIAARTDDILGQFRGQISAYFTSGAIEMEVERQLPYLLPDYIPVISKILTREGIYKAIREFGANAAHDNQLESYVFDRIENVIRDSNLTKEADQVVNRWIAARLTRVQDKLNQICNEYNIDPADMSLVKIHTEVALPDVRVPLILRLFASAKRSDLAMKIFRLFSRFHFGMSKRIQKQLTSQLSDPNGEFAKELSRQLVQELQNQVDLQTQKVEIQIQ